MKQSLLILFSLLAIAVSTGSEAREFRQLKAIPTPATLPADAVAVKDLQPIAREIIEEGVENVMAHWNTPQLQEVLSEDFYDAQRLEDNVQTYAPRDADIRLLSIRGHQLLQQYRQNGNRISRVSVTVSTQVEFEDPAQGFQTRQGTLELVLKVTEPMGEEG